jgi:hypothetical protein
LWSAVWPDHSKVFSTSNWAIFKTNSTSFIADYFRSAEQIFFLFGAIRLNPIRLAEHLATERTTIDAGFGS